jgi:hypothetical protein
MSSPALLRSRSGFAIEALRIERLLSLLHVEDGASELVGKDGEGLGLAEALDQAAVEPLGARIGAQQEHGGLGEGPLEVDVALLAPTRASELARALGARRDKAGVRGKLLHGVEAGEVGDFVEDRHGKGRADAGDGAEAIERGEVVDLHRADESALELVDQRIEGVELGTVGGDGQAR